MPKQRTNRTPERNDDSLARREAVPAEEFAGFDDHGEYPEYQPDTEAGKPESIGDLQKTGRDITIGAFTLRHGTKPGKIWMKGPSGEQSEVDEKVLEDVLKSFF